MLILCVSLLNSCSFSDDRKPVTLALTKDGKTYLFNQTGSLTDKLNNIELPEDFDKNTIPTVPAITEKIRIVEKGDELFIEPSQLENIINLISGNYVILEQVEKSFDGYVSEDEYDIFEKKYGTASTEKIGQMLSTSDIYLSDTAQTKKFHISWERSPNQKPIKNCEEMRIWVDKSYKPGTTTVAKETFIMINLSKIVEFYDSNITINYDKKDEVLYIIVN